MSESKPPPQASPYVGPRPFSRDDRFFYGREREVRELRDLLVAERIVVLYSPSGAGKTSLIQAGLVPKLLESRFHILPVIRVNQPPVAELADRANRYLLSALLSLEAARPSAGQREPDQLAALSLAEYVAQMPRPDNGAGGDVFIFDQFEEILTLDPTDIKAKTEFFVQVGEMLRERGRWALFSLREDHLAALDPYLSAIPTRLETTFRLDLLGTTAARQAIQRPAAEVGVEFTDDAAQRLVDDLCRVRVQQPDGSVEEVSGPYIEPVQLQVVCQRLWDHLAEGHGRIDADLVAKYGDVDGALRDFYSESVKAVAVQTGVPERDIRDWFDEHLITEHGVRSQVQLEAGEGAGLAYPAIQALINTHLVRAESRRGVILYELAHDRLIDPIRADNDEWYEQNLSPLQQAAEIWDSEGRTPGYLLTGEALVKAERWVATHRDSLAAVDLAFLGESQTQRELQEAERNEQQLVVEQQLREAAEARQHAEAAARHEAEQRATEQAAAARKTKRQLQVAAVLGAIAVIAALGAGNLYFRAEEENNRADAQSATAVAALATTEALGRVAQSQLLAEQANNPLALGTALLRAVEALRTADTPQARDVLLRTLQDAPVSRLQGGNGQVAALAFSPDRDVLASVIDGALQLWSIDGAMSLTEPMETGGVLGDVAFTPDGGSIVTGGPSGVQVWRLDTMEPERLDFGAVRDVTSLAISPDGEIVAGDSEGQVAHILLDSRTSEPLPMPSAGTPDSVNDVAVSPDGGWVAAGRTDGTITLWDRRTNASASSISTLPAPARIASSNGNDGGNSVSSLSFDPTGALLAAGYSSGMIWLWDLAQQQEIGSLNQGGAEITSLHFSPDPNIGLIVAADGRGNVVLWDARSQSRVEPLRLVHTPSATSVAFSSDGSLLASGSAQGTIYLWNLGEIPPIATMLADIQLDPLTAAALALPSGHLAIGNEAGDLRLCSLVDGEAAIECEVLNGDFGSIHKLAFSSDGAMVAVGDTGGSIAVFSLDGDQEPRRLSINAPVESLTALTFSRNDRFLIAGVAANVGEPADAENGAGAILLWELETERETRQDRRAPVTALAAGPGTLDVTSYDTEAMIWTIGDGTLTNPRPLPFRPPAPPQALATPSALPASGQVQGLAFDAKANRLAVAGDGGGLVWDMTTNALVFENRAQMLGTQAIAFSPDGSDVATGTGFGAIYVWDIAEGAVAVPLGTLPAAVLDLAWDEQGRLLVVDANGALTALELDAIDWIAEACQTVAEFTPQELPAASDGSSEQTCQDVLSVTGASPVPIG